MIFGKKGKNAQKRVDQAEYWSGRATLLILAGILSQIAGLFLFPGNKSITEIALSLAANIAIGVGLAVEFLCILASVRANADVKQESDKKLAEALDRATEAHRAYIKLRTSRQSILTTEVMASMVEQLRPFSGTKFDVGHDDLDREVWDFLWSLEPTLSKARCPYRLGRGADIQKGLVGRNTRVWPGQR